MTYEEWGPIAKRQARSRSYLPSMYADWTADRDYQRRNRKRLIREARAHHARAEMWYHKCKEYEAFNEPLRRTYNGNTAEEAT